MKIMIHSLMIVSLAVLTTHISIAQWVQTGPSSAYINCFAVSGTSLFAGTDAGVFLSTDKGTSWTSASTGLTCPNVLSLAVKPNGAGGMDLFAGTDSGGVYFSTNDGTRWTEVNTGLSSTNVRALAVSGTYLFAGICSGVADVYLSTNNGTSWAAVNIGTYNNGVHALLVSGTSLFAGAIPNSDLGGGGVHLSTNNGTSWSWIGMNHFSADALALIDINLFAGYGEGVVRFTDDGTSWVMASWGSINTAVYALAVSGINLFAGTGGGVFLSTNNGASWDTVNGTLKGTSVRSLAVSGTNLFAGTSSGVWRRPLSEMVTTVVQQHSEVPTQFALHQNYPNPFNPTTVINYQLPVNGYVTLKIFDLLGREVATLVNEKKDAGTYSVQWNASGFSSGIYFYRLEANGKREIKKMVLMK